MSSEHVVNSAAPCWCEEVDRALDPCGHSDTSEGCPRHDPTMLARQYFCTDGGHRTNELMWCEAVDPTEPDATAWHCLRCGSVIICDECGSEFSVDHARVHERDGFFDAAGPIGRYDLAVYALNGYGLEAEAVLANRTDFVSRGSIAGAFQTYFESSTAAAYLEVVFDWMARPPWRPEPDGDAYGSDIARVYCGHGLPTGPCEECDHPAYTAYLDSIEEEGHPR